MACTKNPQNEEIAVLSKEGKKRGGALKEIGGKTRRREG